MRSDSHEQACDEMSLAMINLDKVPLLGIDVGFSQSRPTTGIAWSADGTFGAAKTHTDWERRRLHLPQSTNLLIATEN